MERKNKTPLPQRIEFVGDLDYIDSDTWRAPDEVWIGGIPLADLIYEAVAPLIVDSRDPWTGRKTLGPVRVIIEPAED